MGDTWTTVLDRCPICHRIVGWRDIFAKGPSTVGCLECLRSLPADAEPEPKIAKGDSLR